MSKVEPENDKVTLEDRRVEANTGPDRWHNTYEGKIAITKEVEWDMGHRVPNHRSKCRNPHGHRYKLRVYVTGQVVEEEGASDQGMLVDFTDLKTMMTERIHDELDHGFVVARGDDAMFESLCRGSELDGMTWKIIVFPYIPTAENIARWCWEQLWANIEAHFRGNLVLDCVKVWETPTSTATYVGPERPY